VTGLRFVKTADVDVLLPIAKACYQHLAQLFRQIFYIEKTMWRLLRNDREFNAAQNRLQQAAYQNYLQPIIPAEPVLNAPQGILPQQHTGTLRTEPLLNSLKDYLIRRQSYQCTMFDYAELDVQRLQWRNFAAKHIVFCEGYRAIHNPYFKHLPFQPVKGEILTAETTVSLLPAILNYGYWLIPLSDSVFKTGATFDTQPLNHQITARVKHTLLTELARIYPSLQPVTLLKQQAGIRPATLDKQPFIGTHPRWPGLHIFNGFGAKGSLQIPYYARQFADYLQQQSNLPTTCDIRRYDDTHFPD
jgi:glycine/D-amino acid oxidase-like deaminating enzyme